MLSETESLYPFVIDAETVQCRKCGIEVTCTWENFAIGSQTPIVICPECLDMLAVKWGQRWIPPEEFLKTRKRRNGLFPVKTPRERLTLKILCFMAGKENSEFCLGIDASKCVILWVEGEAIGYYYAYKLKSCGLPCLGQLYVRPEFRRRGYATRMVQHWLENNPGEVVVESPNAATLHILEKLGLVKRDGEYYVSTGRVSFVYF